MPISLLREKLEIEFEGHLIRGIATGSPNSWSFNSNNAPFKELFPTSILYSFSNYGGSSLQRQAEFQKLVQQTIRGLIISSRFTTESGSESVST